MKITDHYIGPYRIYLKLIILFERSQPIVTKREISLALRFFLFGFKVETPNHDNDLILTPIISPQSGSQWT